jgi:uncharacterized protein YodC (DUF2158 family)
MTSFDIYDTFAQVEEVELKPGGKDIEVTDANKHEYVEYVTNPDGFDVYSVMTET